MSRRDGLTDKEPTRKSDRTAKSLNCSIEAHAPTSRSGDDQEMIGTSSSYWPKRTRIPRPRLHRGTGAHPGRGATGGNHEEAYHISGGGGSYICHRRGRASRRESGCPVPHSRWVRSGELGLEQ